MTPEHVQIVRLSFAKIMNSKMEVARSFYDRLFIIAPDVRSLFKADMDAQARKLMETIALAIASLRDTAMLNEMLGGLAARHAGYGVRDEHYDKVGEALLWALEKNLGADFTPQVRAAWTAVYVAVAGRMRGSSSPQAVRA